MEGRRSSSTQKFYTKLKNIKFNTYAKLLKMEEDYNNNLSIELDINGIHLVSKIKNSSRLYKKAIQFEKEKYVYITGINITFENDNVSCFDNPITAGLAGLAIVAMYAIGGDDAIKDTGNMCRRAIARKKYDSSFCPDKLKIRLLNIKHIPKYPSNIVEASFVKLQTDIKRANTIIKELNDSINRNIK